MVAVLEADGELGSHLDATALSHARREALAPLLAIKAGDWRWSADTKQSAGHLGLLVLDGLLLRRQALGELESIEFLGPGDVLRPWIPTAQAQACGPTTWRALLPTRLAVLDQDFAWRIRHWPQIPAALLERALERTHSLSVTLAIHQAVRVQDRIQMMLWHLADRWGQVTPQGTVLPIPITHEVLAQLVGARRPSVTVALGELGRRGLVQRGPKRSWLLS